MIIDLAESFKICNILVRGVIHIGAWEGEDYGLYKKLDIKNMIFVEADPSVFSVLEKKVPQNDHIFLYNAALCNENKSIDFHVASFSQSSSLLTLKKHKDIYPDIYETKIIKVPGRTLDSLMESHNNENFNFINIDVQGAELLVFQGGMKTLSSIDAINTEINIEEIYENCALLHDLDNFLGKAGFTRVITKTPYHPSWGDAFYIRFSKTGLLC